MLKVTSNLYTNQNIQIKKQTNVFKKNISFLGAERIFINTSTKIPRIEVLPNVNPGFADKIINCIKEFSPDWLKKFKDESYKIILTPTLSEAYKSQKLFDPAVEYFENKNPKMTLGVTYSKDKFGKNFFAFCDKPPYSDEYMKELRNHEFSHGIADISCFAENPQIIEATKKDIVLIEEEKFDTLNNNEKLLIVDYFFNPKVHSPLDEIIADVHAWNLGAGCYGSGVVGNVINPKLMTYLFSNLSAVLKKFML